MFAGNVRISSGVLSDAGAMSLLVVTDAATCPDLDLLLAGMRANWQELAPVGPPPARATLPADPRSTGPPALSATGSGSYRRVRR
jgi:hypothetical protein